MGRQSTEPTYIGCELLVIKGGRILLGLRKNCFGAGTWGLPSGHLEFQERLIDCICREAKEELGATIEPQDLRLTTIVDVCRPGEEHHVHVGFLLLDPAWEPINMEPERCEEWRYFPLDNLPTVLHTHLPLIENYRNKQLYDN